MFCCFLLNLGTFLPRQMSSDGSGKIKGNNKLIYSLYIIYSDLHPYLLHAVFCNVVNCGQFVHIPNECSALLVGYNYSLSQ